MISKIEKAKNVIEGREALETLVAWDYDVLILSEESNHHRINGRLDIWLTTKRYYDLHNHHKGNYNDLEKFVRENYFPNRQGFRVFPTPSEPPQH